jgi:hypothetical protein
LHQTSAEVGSSHEGTLCIVRGSVSGCRIAAFRLCIFRRFDEQ